MELTGVMANVVAFKHLLRNVNFHVYCDQSALVHILKAKRELPTLRLKKLIENLSEYKFDIYFLKDKEMHISDFLSRHPDDEDSPNEIIPIAFMLRELEQPDFPENLLYLKEEVDALLEQEIMSHIMKMTSFSSFLMIVMKTCHCYQTYTVQNIQELRH